MMTSMNLTGFDRDVSNVVRQAEARGWTARRTQKSHIMLCWKNGGTVLLSGTPGGKRSLRNSIAHIRQVERARP